MFSAVPFPSLTPGEEAEQRALEEKEVDLHTGALTSAHELNFKMRERIQKSKRRLRERKRRHLKSHTQKKTLRLFSHVVRLISDAI